MNIWWKDTEGNIYSTGVSPEFDISEIAPVICPDRVDYWIGETADCMSNEKTGVGKRKE